MDTGGFPLWVHAEKCAGHQNNRSGPGGGRRAALWVSTGRGTGAQRASFGVQVQGSPADTDVISSQALKDEGGHRHLWERSEKGAGQNYPEKKHRGAR